MKALLWKDFYATRGSLLIVAVMILLMTGVMAVSDGLGGFFSLYSFLFVSMMPFSSQALDERAKFPRFALSTPISRQDLVLSKYVYSLLLALLAFLVNALDLLLIRHGNIAEVLPLLLMVAVALLMQALIIPLLFRFGSEKARIAMIASLAALSGGLAFFMQKTNMDISRLLAVFAERYALMFVLGVALLYMLSIAVSMRIYKKKDFS
jgi:hypothetical protein